MLLSRLTRLGWTLVRATLCKRFQTWILKISTFDRVFQFAPPPFMFLLFPHLPFPLHLQLVDRRRVDAETTRTALTTMADRSDRRQ
jgi:hypothetical protein